MMMDFNINLQYSVPEYIENNKERFLNELFELLKIPVTVRAYLA